MNSILTVGLLIIVGLFGGFFARKIKFPTISGYIIIGICLSLLNVIPKESISGKLDVITDVSLGIIGYLVGGTLDLKRLKKFGKDIILITPSQLMGAWVVVTLLIAFLGPLTVKLGIPNPNFYRTYLPLAIVIGAISCATAPAATVAVIREYGAKGPLTNTLLPIIALDDALCIIAYAICLSIADALIAGLGTISFYEMLIFPLSDIAGSILLGIGFGFALIYLSRFAKTKQRLLAMVLGMILLCVGTAKALNVSSILTNMTMGFVIINRMKHHENMFKVIDDIEDVVFAMFFTLAGAHFDLGSIKVAGILGLLIFVGRCIGKFEGARIGASISHAPGVIKKYLGFGLLPTAGVAVGLAMLAKQHPAFSTIGNIMISAILVSVMINELIAPPLTKYALFKAGEAFKEK